MSWKDVDKKTIGKNKEKYCVHCKYSGALGATTNSMRRMCTATIWRRQDTGADAAP